eukprot:INCI16368.2.p1 GENE.INCI16368.2~~INCI16368.2.p1  ORF type:complete len:909 (+),score=121.70 INCI16368.2:237-2963(+)
MWRRLLLRRPPASPSPSAAACQIPVPCLYSRSSAVLKIGSTNKNALVRPFSLGLPTADKPAGQQLQARTLSAATSATPSIRGEPIGNAAGGLAADATPAQRQKYRQTLLHIFHHQLTARASKNSPMRFLRRVEESRDIFSADDFEVIMKGLNQLPNDWKLALRLLEIVGEPTSTLYEEAMFMCTVAERHEEVRALWKGVHENNLQPTERMYQSLIRSHTHAGLWPKELDVFWELEQSNPDLLPQKNRHFTYRLILHACALQGEWELALELLQRVEADIIANINFGTNEQRLALYNIAINACVQAGQLDKAKELLPRIANAHLKMSAVTFNTILKGCRPEDAANLFATLRGMGVEPNSRTFNVLIQKEGQAGNWQRALQWFVSMESYGVTPEGPSYTALIYAFGKGGQWRLSVDTFRNMSAAGLEPSLNSMVAVLLACQRTQQYDLVLEMYDQISLGPRTDKAALLRAANVAMHACRFVHAQPRQHLSEEEILDRRSMFKNPHGPTPVWDGTSWNALAFGERVMADLLDHGVEPDAYTYNNAFLLFADHPADGYGLGMTMVADLLASDSPVDAPTAKAAIVFCAKMHSWRELSSFMTTLRDTQGIDWFIQNLNFLVGVPMFHALKAGALDEVLQQLRLLTDLAPGAVIEPSHTAWQMLIDHRGSNSDDGLWPKIREQLSLHDPQGTIINATSGSYRFRPTALAVISSWQQTKSDSAPRTWHHVQISEIPPGMPANKLIRAFRDELGIKGVHDVLCRYKGHGIAQEYVLLFPREDLAAHAAKRLESVRSSAHTDPTLEPFLRRLVVKRPVVTTFEVNGGSASETKLDPAAAKGVRTSDTRHGHLEQCTKSAQSAFGGRSHQLESVSVARIPPGMDEIRLQSLFQQELGVEGIHGLERDDSANTTHDLVRV